MANTLSSSAQRVQEHLSAHGVALNVVELPGSTRTAKDAAQAIGCTVAQIAKSLVFVGQESGELLLVIASGPNRVSEVRLAELAGEPVAMADGKLVKQETGFAIGGIPPVAHNKPLRTFMDQDLLAFDEIWAAAGTPHAVFMLTPQQLQDLAGPQVVAVA